MQDCKSTSVQSQYASVSTLNELQIELSQQLMFNNKSHQLSWIVTTISPWYEHGIKHQVCQHHRAI